MSGDRHDPSTDRGGEPGGPGGTGGPGGSGEDVGSVAEEAAKLFAALNDWARDHGADLGAGEGLGEGLSDLAGHAARAARQVDEHLATGAEECTYCPVCRTVHALRRTSPEVRAHLASAASSLVQAAAGLLATTVPHDRPAAAGVEHIDLDDEPGEWPGDEPDLGKTDRQEEDR